jgi:pimeloyl-[acyl-carrier protein] methyl ester esterase
MVKISLCIPLVWYALVQAAVKKVYAMAQHLVLLHGWGLNRLAWQGCLPALEPHWQCHALDLPGFGDAPWDPEQSTLAAVADTIADYIDAHCDGSAAVLGWSLGGLVATQLAYRHPAKVRHLLTLASSPRFLADDDTQPPWPGMQATIMQQFQRQLNDDFAATLKRFLSVQAMGSPTARQDIKALYQLLTAKPMPHSQALQCGLDWLASSDLRNLLNRLSMPVSRGYGRLDTLVPASVASALEVGSSYIFTRSAHAPFLNQQDDFVAWVNKAL